MKTSLKILISIGMLVIIGLSINKHWGEHWGYTIPLLFIIFSVRHIFELFNKKDKEATYDEEVDSVVIRGRD
jgi:hypothetical protein